MGQRGLSPWGARRAVAKHHCDIRQVEHVDLAEARTAAVISGSQAAALRARITATSKTPLISLAFLFPALTGKGDIGRQN